MIEAEVPRLIVRRARRMRITSDEIDDLQQKIVPKLIAFQYDASRSNGASLTTALIGVIDNQLKAYLRSKRRYKDRIEQMRADSLAASRNRPMRPQHVAETEPMDRKMDIDSVVATLSQRDQAICEGLREGRTKKAIADQVGCGRDTVARVIARIGEAFEKAGLRVWIDPDYEPEVAR
jgi:RNA polymerase sigma factor (sigma-70 family)